MMTRNMLKRKSSASPHNKQHSILKERKKKVGKVKSKENQDHTDSQTILGDANAGEIKMAINSPKSNCTQFGELYTNFL